jgi:signal transduction histidine kinase
VSTEPLDQQRVLSEVSHDLANHFHRSYYFIDLLGGGDGVDSSVLAHLRETIEEIESLARRTLELLRPLDLRLLRVRVEDLTASLRQHIGLRELELTGATAAAKCEVDVDPTRISEALAFLCEASIGDDDPNAPIVVELIDGNPVALRIHRAVGAPRLARADVRLALTDRIVRLHGGALEVSDGDTSSLTLLLPIAGSA